MGNLGGESNLMFVPTPNSVLDLIISNIKMFEKYRELIPLIDPCCGNGDAILRFAMRLGGKPYGNELEAGRAEVARPRFPKEQFVQGDRFHLSAPRKFYLLFSNPPYRNVTGGGRAESLHFEADFKLLIDHGLFIGVFPETIITGQFLKMLDESLYNINIRKFPEPYFSQHEEAHYKQYVVFGNLRDEESKEKRTIEQYNKMISESLGKIPELKAYEFQYTVPENYRKIDYFESTMPNLEEMLALLEQNNLYQNEKFQKLFNPGQMTDIARPLTDPQLGHIGTILLSGIMNTIDLPIDGQTHMVKGRSSKGWKEDNQESDYTPGGNLRVKTHSSEKAGSTIHAMNMATGRILEYDSLKDRVAFANFLDSHQEIFVKTIFEQFPSLFDPNQRDEHCPRCHGKGHTVKQAVCPDCNGTGEALSVIEKFLPMFNQIIPPGPLPGTAKAEILPAQMVAVTAFFHRLFGDGGDITPSKSALLVGEMGVGKTLMIISLMAMMYQAEIQRHSRKPNPPKRGYTEQELAARAAKAKRTQNKCPQKKMARKMVVSCPANIPAEWKAQASQALAQFGAKVYWIGEEKSQEILVEREGEPKGFSALEAYGGSRTARMVKVSKPLKPYIPPILERLKRFRYALLERNVGDPLLRKEAWDAYKLVMHDQNETAANQFVQFLLKKAKLDIEDLLAPRPIKSGQRISYDSQFEFEVVSYGKYGHQTELKQVPVGNGATVPLLESMQNPEPAQRRITERFYGKYRSGRGGRGLLKTMKCSRPVSDTSEAMAQDGLVVLVVSMEKLKAGANWRNLEPELMQRMTTQMGWVENAANPKAPKELKRLYFFDQPRCPVCGKTVAKPEVYADEPLSRHYCDNQITRSVFSLEKIKEEEHPVKAWVIMEGSESEGNWEYHKGQWTLNGDLVDSGALWVWKPTGEKRVIKYNIGKGKVVRCGEYVQVEGNEADVPSGNRATPLWTMYPHSNGGRVPIARVLNKYYGGEYHLFLDEIHKMKSGGSDGANISQAMMQVIHGATKVVGATGTVYAGYAKDIYYILYRLFPWMREQFGYFDEQKFVETYGFQRRTLTETYDGGTNANGYSTNSKMVYADIPGVTPSIIMMLLSYSVFIRKDDLGIEMPPFNESVLSVDWDSRLDEGKEALMKMYTPGAQFYTPMAIVSKWRVALEMGGWLDCPITEDIVCKWTERNKDGSKEHHTQTFHIPGIMSHPDELLDPPLKKDAEALEIVKQELAIGRGVMIFCEFTERYPVQTRLQKLFAKHGIYSEVLLPQSNVKASGRGKWYKDAVAAARANGQEPVVIVPGGMFVEGINCLETPTTIEYGINHKINVLRQRGKRAHRANQPNPVEIVFLTHKGSFAERALRRCIIPKLRAASTVDGQLLSEALAAFSPDDDDISSVVHEMMSKNGIEKQEDWENIRTYDPSQYAAPKVVEITPLEVVEMPNKPIETKPVVQAKKRTPMQVAIDLILSAWQRQDDFYEALENNKEFHLKVESEGYEPLVIEVVPGFNEPAIISVLQFYMQNGDVMYDPEITFDQNWKALEFTNHGMGIYHRQGVEASFLNLWAKNLKEQGFTDGPPLTEAMEIIRQKDQKRKGEGETMPQGVAMPMMVAAIAKATKPKPKISLDDLVMLAGGNPTPPPRAVATPTPKAGGHPTPPQSEAKPMSALKPKHQISLDDLVMLAGGNPTPSPSAPRSTPKPKGNDDNMLAMLAMLAC